MREIARVVGVEKPKEKERHGSCCRSCEEKGDDGFFLLEFMELQATKDKENEV
uniref:Beta tubulin n=1 Tax=Medicago truncatula TaxID=3880 RepID=A2Q1G8_MEDTR|nr:Beta tubulin [Medicago truncatula]